MQVNIYELVF